MSSKRLGWMGVSCAALAVLVAGLGVVVQIGLVLFGLFVTGIVSLPLVPLAGLGSETGSIVVPVPRVMPVATSISGLLLAITLACAAGVVRNRLLRAG